ncbi:Ctr copper transporter family-domain-containing protein [Gorgonomyces haynaldii]|nr:Ctr copper transporter family-domain-containing protein [Gorgonomyces haynaldii]
MSPSLCPSAGDSDVQIPAMQMFFHSAIAEYILFKEWVPKNKTQYAGACIGVFFLAVLYEGLTSFIRIQEYKWDCALKDRRSNKRQVQEVADAAFGASKQPPKTSLTAVGGFKDGVFGVFVAVMKGLLKSLSVAISYALMLIAMTFNVGLFLSVVFGFGFGTICFAPLVSDIVSPSLEGTQDVTGCH